MPVLYIMLILACNIYNMIGSNSPELTGKSQRWMALWTLDAYGCYPVTMLYDTYSIRISTTSQTNQLHRCG